MKWKMWMKQVKGRKSREKYARMMIGKRKIYRRKGTSRK